MMIFVPLLLMGAIEASPAETETAQAMIAWRACAEVWAGRYSETNEMPDNIVDMAMVRCVEYDRKFLHKATAMFCEKRNNTPASAETAALDYRRSFEKRVRVYARIAIAEARHAAP